MDVKAWITGTVIHAIFLPGRLSIAANDATLVGHSMFHSLKSTGIFLAVIASTSVAAEPSATVTFREAAPTDLFEVINTSENGSYIATLHLDLSDSLGGALFDPVRGGAGVLSVYPFTLIEGAEVTGFRSVTGDTDGSQQLTLHFEHFDPGEHLVFGIDVDDTRAGGVPVQNRITEEELTGSLVRMHFCQPDGEGMTLENLMTANQVQLDTSDTVSNPGDDPHAGCLPQHTEQAMILDFSHGNWQTINDGVMGGVSSSTFQQTEAGTGRFEGIVSLANNGGFASVRMPLERHDFGAYRGLRIYHRGDGQRYRLRLHDNPRRDSIAYQTVFQTAATWQQTDLPFEVFSPTFRGRVPPAAPPLDVLNIQQLGLMIADEQAGPFWLEIGYIDRY